MVTRIYNANMQAHVIQKSKIENTAVNAATDFLSADLVPSKTPCKFKIYISMSVAGKFDVFRNGISTGERMNDDVNLVANVPYAFEVEVGRGDTDFNFQYSVNATIREFIVKEVPA